MTSPASHESAAQQPAIAVVIPAYFAEQKIGSVIKGIPEFVSLIVVVDDCSADRTGAVVGELRDPRVCLITHSDNRGVGGATMTGFAKARELGATIIVKMDSDGQMDPGYLPHLIGPIAAGEADVCKGNRFLLRREIGQMPFVRRLGNLGLSFLTKGASGYWNIFDPTNGYLAIHSSIIPLLDQASIDQRYFFESSLLIELGMIRAVVKDVPIPARYGDETSHLSEWKALFGFPPRLLKGLFNRVWLQYFLRDFGLTSIFMTVGLLVVLFGGMFGGYHWFMHSLARTATPTGTIMIAAVAVILGIQFLLQSLLLDVQNVPTTPVTRNLGTTTAVKTLPEPMYASRRE
jgi:dolichol-phosphate mannosyltransferase